MKTLLTGHTNKENAYIIADYPYGYRLRCKMRCWIETATKGKGKGEQRYCTQTTNPKITSMESWNKEKCGTYAPMVVMYLDEAGHVHCSHLHHYYDGAVRFVGFREEFYDQMTDDMKKHFHRLEDASRLINPESWKKWNEENAVKKPEEVDKVS